MPAALQSRLSYKDANARLDAQRKVLICPGCGDKAPWTDAIGAVKDGWDFEDRTVNGERIRFWFCNACKTPVNIPPAQPPPLPRGASLSEAAAAMMQQADFASLRTIALPFGKSGAKQLAVVLREHGNVLVVTAWRDMSGTWTRPKEVGRRDVLCPFSSSEARHRRAVAAWPPDWFAEWARKRSKRRR